MISVASSMGSLNIPYENISRFKMNQHKTYIYDGTKNTPAFSNNFIESIDGIMVAEDMTAIITPDYLNTSIVGKDVYAPLHLYGGYLPTSHPTQYKIVDAGSTLPEDSNWDFKKIEYDNETTVANLYTNASWYQYSFETDTFIKLPENGALQNKLKLYMQKRIMEIGGDSYDRIADLSRVVLFLLSKATLTEEEHNIIDPLITDSQTSLELADVFQREKNIQDYVASVKANPKGYINGEF